MRQNVNELSALWNKPDTPGYALAIIGMVDLEHQVAIWPSTVFHVASMSKQFTILSRQSPWWLGGETCAMLRGNGGFARADAERLNRLHQ